jgi:hypothetical protein
VKAYRKKPVVINAVQWDGTPEGATEIIDWILAQPGGHTARYNDYEPDHDTGPGIMIDTLEGTMRADRDDWVVRGIAGEFYPVKPDIFADLYDEEIEPEERQSTAVTWVFEPDPDTAQEQVDILAKFIMDEVPGEPSRSEGAVAVAIRLIRATL